jgi:hypothetical protein
MLMLISPAKNLDYDTAPVTDIHTQPDYIEQAQLLIDELKQLAPHDISELMHISDKLGQLNFSRYHSWENQFSFDNAKQAVLAFNGDVYGGLDAQSFNEAQFAFAQQHLRILSGLYGLLKPLDLMQPYRLEMGTKFENQRGKNLYAFWGDMITDAVNTQLQRLESKELLNLASNEYFKVIKPKKLEARVITPVFKELKNGQYKIISFYAKKARGLMAGYVIRQGIERAEDIKQFDCEGYAYAEDLSTADQWVFTRDLAS